MHRKLFRLTLIGGVISLLLIALTVGGVRFLLPQVEHYRGDVEAYLAGSVDRPVHIGAMHIGWQGWGPVLRVDDVLLMDKADTAEKFRLRQVTVSLDPWVSLKTQTLKLARLDIEGVRLTVHRFADGGITVGGIKLGLNTNSEAEVLVLPPNLVSLSDTELVWQDDIFRPGLPPVLLRNVEIMLSNEGRDYRFQIDGELSVGMGKHISGVFEMEGEEGFVGDLSGRAFIEVDGLVISEWLASNTPLGDKVKQAHVDLKLWADVAQSRLRNAQGSVNFHHLDMRDFPALESGNAEFQWRRLEDGWAVNVERLKVNAWNETPFQSGLSLIFNNSDPTHKHLLGAIDDVDLNNLLSLAKGGKMLPASAQQALEKMQPEGLVDSIRFALDLEDETGFKTWMAVRDLQFERWQNIPGVKGVDADVYIDHEGALLDLNSRNVRVDVTTLFRAPFEIDLLQGQISFSHQDQDWRVQAPGLAIVNKDIATRSRFDVLIPADGSVPQMSLISDFVDGDGSRVSPYLPAAIMPKEAVAWLDQGLVNANVLQGGVVYRGALDGMPFDDHSGRLEIRLEVEDGIVDYLEGWPRLEEGVAEVTFINTRVDVHAIAGKILNADLPSVHVWVPDMVNTKLHIEGRAEASGDDMLQFLLKSPLKEDFGVFFENMTLAGQTQLELDVYAPLDAEGEVNVEIDGHLYLAGNSLRESKLDVDFKDLNGRLQFTQDGLYAKGIKGRFNGLSVVADVDTQEGGGLTEISLRAHGNAQQLAGSRLSGLDNVLLGETDWLVKLGFETDKSANGVPATQFSVSSDLVGVRIKAPEPFAKKAEERRSLHVNTHFGSTLSPLRVNYGGFADLVLAMEAIPGGEGQRVRGGELKLGGEPAEIPRERGFRVVGSLPKLSLTNLPRFPSEDSAAKAQPGFPALNKVDLRLKELDLGEMSLHDVHLLASKTKTGWAGSIDSREAKGIVELPANTENGQPLIAKLQRLHLAAGGRNAETKPPLKPSETSSASVVDPRLLPALRITVDDFKVDDVNFGSLKIITVKLPDGVKIIQATVDNGKLKGEARGDWQVDGEQQLSRINVTMTSLDLGGTLDDMGFEHTVSGGNGLIKLQGGWLGSPMDFQLQALEGDLTVKFNNGILLDVDPGTGGRVFGLFSISALPRRLQLDFTDMFKKGFSFDEIKGNFIISEGDAYTSNLFIQGPPARVDISGRTGFANQDYDQQVVVTPDVSSTVAAASALVINPAVGAAVFLVQKLLRNPLDKITRFRYAIQGPWDQPDIIKLGKEEIKIPEETDGRPTWNSISEPS